MSKPTRKICFVSVIGVLLSALTVLPAFANSAQSYWEGVGASGVLVTDGECPLVVEHETLTFDIADFPSPHGSIEAYGASVTAEYTFYNPSDMTVTANLLFPFGVNPYYAEHYDPEKGEYIAPDNVSKYGAQLDGAAVETVVRHSYWDGSLYNFNPTKEMAKLYDVYRTDSFLSYDLPVHVYTYRAEVDRQTYRTARAATYFADGAFDKTRFMIGNLGGWSSDENGNAGYASVHISNAEITTVYVFGEDVGELKWTFFENGSLETEIEGTMTVIDRTSTTFGELAMQFYDPVSGVAEHDWFNAIVAQLEESGKTMGLYDTYQNWDVSKYLLQWYEYKITLAPGERLINTVKAPLYPGIDEDFETPVYSYEYFLSPASLWKEFGTLDIYINTPYVMVKERIGEFSIAPDEWTKTDAGYELHLDSLPDEDLVFTLCEVENPKRVVTAYTYLAIGIIAVAVLAVIALVVIGIPIVFALIALAMAVFSVMVVFMGTVAAVLFGIAALIIAVLTVVVIKCVKKRKQKKTHPKTKAEQAADTENE